jgi:type I restriction enzyme S subunit
MIFNKVSIGEVVTLRQGFAINKNTKHHMSDEPTDLHLLRIGDMKDGSYSIYVKDTIPAHFIANEDDIIYTRTGQVGLVFRKQHGVIHNNCFSVTPQNEDVLDRGFLFYVLQTKEFYEEANSKASGAAQPDLPHGAFNSISIPIPDIDIQRKISNILKSYDDLIENNQKQIKLLEEAAQRLYKEWFVDLRFPGYEKTEIIDGVPVGWKKEKLVKIADIKAGGDKPEEYSNNKTRENSIPIYANGTEKEGLFGYTNKPVITDESVTISARGTVGCVFLRRTPYVPIVRLLSVIPYEVSAVYLYYC